MYASLELSKRLLGRTEHSYFLSDCDARAGELREAIHGRRLLVVGGAGSIGAETVRQAAALQPAALHVVDLDESALAELVRDLRSQAAGMPVADFRTLPIDFGSPLMDRFLAEGDGYDLVLNFAALKHVRSEKDVYSLLRLLDTNLVKVARLARALPSLGARRFFSVSTDKAANPTSLMGASKRAMEDLTFGCFRERVAASSARFANVAFSRGSLLESFTLRLAKRQPLAAPRDTRRYFLTIEEAGRLCLLASALPEPQHVVIPGAAFRAFDQEIQEIAVRFLQEHGWEPEMHHDEEEARRAVPAAMARRAYPLLLTPRDTSGEKAAEVFVGRDEVTKDIGFQELEGIAHVPLVEPAALAATMSRLEALTGSRGPTVTKHEVVELVRCIVPSLAHFETGRHLDQRM